MLLLMVNERSGPGVRYLRYGSSLPPQETDRLASFATHLPLREALTRLVTHQNWYNGHYALAVNFTLLSVSTIDTSPPELLRDLRVEMIEDLTIADEPEEEEEDTAEGNKGGNNG